MVIKGEASNQRKEPIFQMQHYQCPSFFFFKKKKDDSRFSKTLLKLKKKKKKKRSFHCSDADLLDTFLLLVFNDGVYMLSI
jgi:hypothetical protein